MPRSLTKLIHASLLITLFVSPASFAQDNCPAILGFSVLQEKIKDSPPAQALRLLNNFSAKADIVASCQADKIEALFEQVEQAHFRLENAQKNTVFAPQVILRCNQFNRQTAQCTLPKADDTLRYQLSEHPVFLQQPSVDSRWHFATGLPGYQLLATYRMSMQSAPAVAQTLPKALSSKTLWPSTEKKQAIIAIYKTSGAWQYRKVVWYFE